MGSSRKWCSGGLLLRVFVSTILIQTGVSNAPQDVTQTVTTYAVLILEVLTRRKSHNLFCEIHTYKLWVQYFLEE